MVYGECSFCVCDLVFRFIYLFIHLFVVFIFIFKFIDILDKQTYSVTIIEFLTIKIKIKI